ncbi:MAG TPA: DUF3466 family protein [Phycisphaerales bacterium]|nr:DUF3466 family protein [Phycisphaerales bacterium]
MLCATLPASAQCQYEVIPIYAPLCNGQHSPAYALSINELGQVCGYYTVCGIGANRPFIWKPLPGDPDHGTFTTIPLPPGFTSGQANDINDNGVVVGYGQKTGLGFRAFIYKDGVSTELPPFHGPDEQGWSNANAINNAGTVVGYRSIGSRESPINPKTAFLWNEKNGFTDLYPLLTGPNSEALDIDEDGTIVGWTGIAFQSTDQAFVFRNGSVSYLPTLPGFAGATPRTTSGSFVGGSANFLVGIQYYPRAVVWRNGFIHDLGILPGHDMSTALAINDRGQTVGVSSSLQGDATLVLWLGGETFDINNLLLDPKNFGLGAIYDINDQGIMCGSGIEFFTPSHIAVVLRPVKHSDGDVNGDCAVNIDDLTSVILGWGKSHDPADLDQDGVVDAPDMLLVIENWSV